MAAIIDLIQRSIDPIKDVTGKMGSIQRALSGINRIMEFLNQLEKGVRMEDSLGGEKIEFESWKSPLESFLIFTSLQRVRALC